MNPSRVEERHAVRRLLDRRLLLGLEVVEEDGALLGFLTPVTDDDAGAVDDLAGVALTVKLACSEQSAKSPQHIPTRRSIEPETAFWQPPFVRCPA